MILKKTIIIGLLLTLFSILFYSCTAEDIEKAPVQKLPTVKETENVNNRLDSGDKESAIGLPKR